MNAPTVLQKENHSTRNMILVVIGLIAICVLCALCLLVLSFFGIFSSKPEVVTVNTANTTATNTTTNTTNATPQNQEPPAPTTKVFVGTYVTATIPVDWTIKEYSNAAGMEAYVDSGSTTFSGLTGLEVINENNTVVFSFKGIDGIGGGGGCSTVGKFADTDANYIQSVKDETDAVGFGTTDVIDLTTADYSAINTLGLRFRRVDNQMYVAKNFSASFNTACGIERQFVKINDLSFNIVDGGDSYSANAYKFEINTSVTSEPTLLKLDDVLNSLKAKSVS